MSKPVLPPMLPQRILAGSLYREFKRELVYGWFRNNTYLYIGSTQNGLARPIIHNVIDVHDTVMNEDEIHIWYSDTGEILELEQELIDFYKPKFNYINHYHKPQTEQICLNPHCKKKFIVKRKWQKFCNRKCSGVKF